MRFIPLAPVLLLLLGAALMELLVLDRKTGVAQQFSAVLDQVRVTSNASGFSTKFAATSLEIGEVLAVANQPVGRLELGSGNYDFRADKLHSLGESGDLVLQGNVRFAKKDIVLNSSRSVINKDGVITGENPRATLANNHASASTFIVDSDGEISFTGSFRATLFQ